LIPDLSVKIGKVKFSNPVLVASGTFGYGEEYGVFFDLNKLGGIIT
jgi:dihydroorotate dehydrogenase (NAD+) catalytic subunit